MKISFSTVKQVFASVTLVFEEILAQTEQTDSESLPSLPTSLTPPETPAQLITSSRQQ
ncbi:hypothetical protein [uncultured Nostoc sp.]|uniref:hypothetical protein n=1 Tax=uncultured Nostoc sp. TaxID=340711 RepID=UPI0035C9D59E